MEQPSYLLYSSVGCHLCEQAYALCLTRLLASQVRIVDILDDDDKAPEQPDSLYQQYGLSIPVLKRVKDQAELFWPFNQAELIGFLSK